MRVALADAVENLDGWTSIEELWALHEVVRHFPGGAPVTVVEIGAWKGRSTVALALGVHRRASGTVFSIDPHTGNRESREVHGTVDTFNDFLQNITSKGVVDVVQPIRSTSHEA